MAHLTQQEFTQAITHLSDDLGLQRLRDRFVRYNALVTRRRVASVQALADQLYQLTGGMRRAVPATYAFQTIWAQQVNEKLGEEGEKELEELADKVNACLGEHDHVVPDKKAELGEALRAYEGKLATAIGGERARIDMLMKAVPDVAVELRNMPLASGKDAPAAAPVSSTADSAAEPETDDGD
jgi:hypothetical protein